MKQWSYINTILKICGQLFPGKDFLQSSCDETTKKSHRINNFCITTTASQYKDPFDIDAALIEYFLIEKDKSFFYDFDFHAGGILPYWEVHEKKVMWRNIIGLC